MSEHMTTILRNGKFNQTRTICPEAGERYTVSSFNQTESPHMLERETGTILFFVSSKDYCDLAGFANAAECQDFGCMMDYAYMAFRDDVFAYVHVSDLIPDVETEEGEEDFF